MCRQNLIVLFRTGIIITLAFIHLAGMSKGRVKTDKIILLNGDVVTCEIKKLEYGLMTAKTSDMGTLEIKWNKIARILSTYLFEVEMGNGDIHYGKFGDPTADGKVSIVSGPTYKEYDMMQVVGITQIDNKFWTRLDGSVQLGLNLTKANQLFQWSTNFNTTYRARKYHGSITYSGNYQLQSDIDPISRQDATLTFIRTLKSKWFGLGLFGATHNTELGLKLRLSLGAAPGKAVIQNNRTSLGVFAGMVANREWSLDSVSTSSVNLEGLLGIKFSKFKYDTPKSNITTSLIFYPGLIPWGRYRVEIGLDISQEIVKDFTIGLNGYLSYDTDPITIGASQLDYSVNLVLGYTW